MIKDSLKSVENLFESQITFDMIVWESEPGIKFPDKIETVASMLSGLRGWKSNTIT